MNHIYELRVDACREFLHIWTSHIIMSDINESYICDACHEFLHVLTSHIKESSQWVTCREFLHMFMSHIFDEWHEWIIFIRCVSWILETYQGLGFRVYIWWVTWMNHINKMRVVNSWNISVSHVSWILANVYESYIDEWY